MECTEGGTLTKDEARFMMWKKAGEELVQEWVLFSAWSPSAKSFTVAGDWLVLAQYLKVRYDKAFVLYQAATRDFFCEYECNERCGCCTSSIYSAL